MVGLLIGLVAYIVFSAGQTFGADLIYSLNVMESWYFFVLCIASVMGGIIGVLFLIGGTAGGAELGGKAGGVLGFLAGGSFGTLVVAKIVSFSLAQYWICTWLMQGIDPAIVDADALTTKQFIALAMLVIIPMVNRATISNSNSSSNSDTITLPKSQYRSLKKKSKSRITFS